jgi:hypothetical protein
MFLQLLFLGLSVCVFSRGCKGSQKVKNTFKKRTETPELSTVFRNKGDFALCIRNADKV